MYLVQELKTILAFCDHTFLSTFVNSFIITSSFISCIHILLHSINHVVILLRLPNPEAFILILQEARWKGDCQSCKIKKKTSFFCCSWVKTNRCSFHHKPGNLRNYQSGFRNRKCVLELTINWYKISITIIFLENGNNWH